MNSYVLNFLNCNSFTLLLLESFSVIKIKIEFSPENEERTKIFTHIVATKYHVFYKCRLKQQQ